MDRNYLQNVRLSVGELLKYFSECLCVDIVKPEAPEKMVMKEYQRVATIIRLRMKEISESDLQEVSRLLETAVEEAESFALSGFASEMFYAVHVELVDRGCDVLPVLMRVSKNALFNHYLHRRDLYYRMVYAFYRTCGLGIQIKKKGVFDVVRYVEKKHDYAGVETDLVMVVAYVASLGVRMYPLVRDKHQYHWYDYHLRVKDDYLSLLSAESGRINHQPSAIYLYNCCVKPYGDSKEPLFAGAAYFTALYSGFYTRRKNVARMFKAEHLMEMTDEDRMERKAKFIVVAALSAILTVGVMILYNIYQGVSAHPFEYQVAGAFLAYVGFLLLGNVVPRAAEEAGGLTCVYCVNPVGYGYGFYYM